MGVGTFQTASLDSCEFLEFVSEALNAEKLVDPWTPMPEFRDPCLSQVVTHIRVVQVVVASFVHRLRRASSAIGKH